MGGGVEVFPAAARVIGKLTDLHTLGVVNVAGTGNGKGGLLFLEELKKLTQMRKLGLSGINRNNWANLCKAISGHLHHLESLSLQLMLLEEDGNNFEFARFDDIPDPPKTLKSLKVLYGSGGQADAGAGAWVRPVWIKQLPNLKRLSDDDLELTISSQEDMDFFTNALPYKVCRSRFRVKPIEEELKLFGMWRNPKFNRLLDALKIDCSTTTMFKKSEVTFEKPEDQAGYKIRIKVLNIHCCSSCGLSCLRISGLKNIRKLKQVLVTGSCGDDLRQDLRNQLQDHPDKPVTLKVNGSTVL